MKAYIFYPGCSMESSAKAYYHSVMQVCQALDVHLKEIDDWNCCGATEYLSVDRMPAYALIARNLALAEQQANGSKTVVAPCSACYLNLAKADHYMQEDPVFGEKINQALAAGGLHYTPGTLAVRHLLDVVLNDIGLEAIRSKVTKPLIGLRVAPYVGCMLPRPDYNKRYSDPEHPTELDDLLKALGAEVIDFPLKTACCGGHMTQIGPGTAFELIRRIVAGADRYKADVIITLCPMCQLNLDAFQGQMNSYFKTNYQIPVLFFTQLMGIAFGIAPEKLGFGSEFVSAQSAMSRIGVKTPEPQPAAPAAKKPSGLPMPPPLKKGASSIATEEAKQ
ncbi:MAG: CoB--CoM heterodisulfide reductase iron-sulfur subunit B family protein [Anaerolineales bacterium]|nr:CoB--CoM heterodisulfide reductase iron-sulfur subunit B family protein [Anaerolineales bacterium]MCX7609130.1 CoB--CoM heterodisulfide reductase iron-sulfur subunit B family protein [Anaerolineales bacterium]